MASSDASGKSTDRTELAVCLEGIGVEIDLETRTACVTLAGTVVGRDKIWRARCATTSSRGKVTGRADDAFISEGVGFVSARTRETSV